MGMDAHELSRLGPEAQRQIFEKTGIAPPAARTMPGKYHNVRAERISVDGTPIKFDSQKEARRYDELVLMLKAGKIRDLKLQPQFTLQESYKTPEGKRIEAIRYVADFSYIQNASGGRAFDRVVVEDVKSEATKTRQYKLKKKLVRERFGIEVQEV